MNMIDLIVLLCSLSSPNACSERHLLFEAHGTLKSCMMEAQPYLAQWMDGHPNERIARWRCAWPETEGGAI